MYFGYRELIGSLYESWTIAIGKVYNALCMRRIESEENDIKSKFSRVIKGKKLKKELVFEGSVIKKCPQHKSGARLGRSPPFGKVMIICN